ncbi:hypothetical protein [Paracoccus sp. (in: a-proteobacteria)]|uniref:hypothetical protein n=1 Tax=Paracoccus sp. TaxID=267 RepID=UPI0035ADC5D9
MPGRSFARHADPAPLIDLGVPYMFDVQTELHLRRTERGHAACDDTGRATRAILIAANLSALSLLAAALL